MVTKQELLNELDALVDNAEVQTALNERSNEYLYRGLAGVYLWWRKARKIDGFLQELYEQKNIKGKNGGEEKFTQVLRLVWHLNWDKQNKSNMQQWSLALREVHKEYESNTAAYKKEPQLRLAQFIDSKGGITVLINPKLEFDFDPNEEKKKSAKKIWRSKDDTLKIENKHLELGEQYFATSAPTIVNVVLPKAIAVNRKGYAIALIRKVEGNKYDVLSSVDDEEQIKNAIISSYKRDDKAAPNVLRLLTEVVCTQTLPKTLEKSRFKLADVVGKNEKKEPVRQNKRVLFRKVEGDILLSENKTGCSVVTIAKPLSSPLLASEDVFLNVNDRRYIEQAIIQKHELSFCKTADDYKIPMTRSGIVASHKLVVENKVTGKLKGLFFYKTNVLGSHALPQANLRSDYEATPKWQASIDSFWLENLSVHFVGSWLREYGDHITRAKHKVLQFDFGKTGLVIKHYGENGNFSNSSPLLDIKNITKSSKPIAIMFAAKDILPVLNGLMELSIDGDMTFAANEDLLSIVYKTDLASYTIAIPTCNTDGKRNDAAFAAYGE
jgi:hypothetical protein